MLATTIKLTYCDVVTVTRENEPTQGAILFELAVANTGEIKEVWIPNKLLSNICPAGYFVYVWDKFAKENLTDYLHKTD